ncbi:MAG: SDR family oxidoreductase [Rhizomicrobium sp.]
MTDTFSGRQIIVTGGGRGIGKAVALAFAKGGGGVHTISHSANAVAAADEIAAAGGRAHGHVGSVADEAFCKSVVEGIEREAGAVDILVNAAAMLGPHGNFAGLSMDDFRDVLMTNLMGTCNLMRWCLPAMTRKGFGRIVNFAGGGAAYSYPEFSPYGVSKAAVVRLTETVADEVAATGVTANVIAPGAVATDMLTEVKRRGGEVRTVVGIEEPVNLVLFLAGPDAGHITGRFIHARDNYRDATLFETKDMLKLRRTERR